MSSSIEQEFPCALYVTKTTSYDSSKHLLTTTPRTIDVPLTDHRLAWTALHAIQVDAELSPLVRRSFSLVSPTSSSAGSGASPAGDGPQDEAELNVLRTEYRATTNRMLRVAVNGFMESLGVVLQIMQQLDVDVLTAQGQSRQSSST